MSMSPKEEAAYERGSRQAFSEMLSKCLAALGYTGTEAARLAWIREREAAVAALRSLCGNHGDNDWDEHLHLSDIVEKHLGRHLDSIDAWSETPAAARDAIISRMENAYYDVSGAETQADVDRILAPIRAAVARLRKP